MIAKQLLEILFHMLLVCGARLLAICAFTSSFTIIYYAQSHNHMWPGMSHYTDKGADKSVSITELVLD